MISSYNFTVLKQKTQDPLYKFQCSINSISLFAHAKKKSTVVVVNAIVILQCVKAEI